MAGDVNDELRPEGHNRHRTDVYHLASLGPESSLKRRNSTGPLEWKTRIGRPEPCEIAGVPGLTERWVKRRLRERDLDEPLSGDWIDVDKQLWRVGGMEICRVEMDTQQWWTIAVPSGRLNKTMRKTLAFWRPLLLSGGEASSYPLWLLARCNEHPVDHINLEQAG